MVRRKRDWKRYNHFRKIDVGSAIESLAQLIVKEKPPYKVRPSGTRGRPPANPRAIAMFTVIMGILNKSYRETYSYIFANPTLWREDFFGKIPAPNTVNDHIMDIPERYLDRLLKQQSRRLKKGNEQ
jgi:hypothetical protein